MRWYCRKRSKTSLRSSQWTFAIHWHRGNPALSVPRNLRGGLRVVREATNTGKEEKVLAEYLFWSCPSFRGRIRSAPCFTWCLIIIVRTSTQSVKATLYVYDIRDSAQIEGESLPALKHTLVNQANACVWTHLDDTLCIGIFLLESFFCFFPCFNEPINSIALCLRQLCQKVTVVRPKGLTGCAWCWLHPQRWLDRKKIVVGKISLLYELVSNVWTVGGWSCRKF